MHISGITIFTKYCHLEHLFADVKIPEKIQYLHLSEPILAISFIQKGSFKSSLQSREGELLPKLDWKQVSKEKSLIAKCCASQSTFWEAETLGTTKRSAL